MCFKFLKSIVNCRRLRRKQRSCDMQEFVKQWTGRVDNVMNGQEVTEAMNRSLLSSTSRQVCETFWIFRTGVSFFVPVVFPTRSDTKNNAFANSVRIKKAAITRRSNCSAFATGSVSQFSCY